MILRFREFIKSCTLAVPCSLRQEVKEERKEGREEGKKEGRKKRGRQGQGRIDNIILSRKSSILYHLFNLILEYDRFLKTIHSK